jgi:hypothetical protein
MSERARGEKDGVLNRPPQPTLEAGAARHRSGAAFTSCEARLRFPPCISHTGGCPTRKPEGEMRAPVGPACSGSGNDQGVASISRCGVRRNTCTTPLPRPALWQCLGLKSFKGMPLKRHLSFRGWLTVKCSGSCGPYHAAKFAGMMRKSVGKYHEFKLISFRSRLFFELQF